MKKILLIIFIALAVLLTIFIIFNGPANSNMIFGVSFNPYYARYLGFKAEDVYKTILDDWQFKYIRLSAQWDDIEVKKGQYNFTELDWLMDEAAKRKAKVTLVVGRKVPRWPECHLPEWVERMKYQEYRPFLIKFMEQTVKRYRNHSALEIWQVENEPFLSFGLCKTMPEADLKEEIKLVKNIDNQHPVMITDSGELSAWRKTAKTADLFGTTMYRVVWNKRLGYFNYDWLPAAFYRWKLKLAGRDFATAYIVELQAEPWIPNHTVENTPLSEQFKSMNIARLKKNVNYARAAGMPRAYLWGAEWWYWMQKKHGRSEYAEYVKTLKRE